MVAIFFMLFLVGLIFGSFVNALVWRLHEQNKLNNKTKAKKQSSKKSFTASTKSKSMSILQGRSMCTHCKHQLMVLDLMPVVSWLSLGGKCRYCKAPIGTQYPVVELLTGLLFAASYVFWPMAFTARGITSFVIWCVVLTGFMALFIYDLKWMILPNRITYPLMVIASVGALLNIVIFKGGYTVLQDTVLSVVIASGLFYGLFQISKGKWIGGGDPKLGLIIGLILGIPLHAFLMLFLASLIGTFVSLPGMVSKKINASTHIPFGPFLIVATIIVKLFGGSLIIWYRRKFLLY